MTQALPKLVNFEEFVEWLPENSAVRYELHNRNIIEIVQPVGEHEEVKGFLTIEIAVANRSSGIAIQYPQPSDS
jgi:Uma2 family endonuclease